MIIREACHNQVKGIFYVVAYNKVGGFYSHYVTSQVVISTQSNYMQSRLRPYLIVALMNDSGYNREIRVDIPFRSVA